MLKNTFYPALVITAALLVFGLPLAPPALAVTFTVNSTADLPDDLTIPGTCHTVADTCTLRAAIMQANRTSGAGATIILPAGLYTLTIPAAGANGEENGDLNLTAPPTLPSPAISIKGAGADQTIIDGNHLDRVFYIAAEREVSISGIKITNGYCLGDGGGIKNLGTLTVTNSTVSDNVVVAGTYGGGISSALGTLTVTSSTIAGNKTTAGNYKSPKAGGGISISSGRLTVTNSTIADNHSGEHGGGIYNYNGYIRVINSTIASNQGLSGGGIFNQASAEVIDSMISSNQAFIYGGGIYHEFSQGLRITNSTISGNQADHDGGGIYSGGILITANTTISGNIAFTSGGGIYNNFQGNTNIYNSTITQNNSDYDRDPNGGIGGGVYNDPAGIFNIRNTLVAGNYTQDAPVPDDCYGILGSFGRNLFGDLAGCTIINGGGTWGYFSGGLGPLQNHGGPTWTQALRPGSNAIDGGDPELGCIGPDGHPLATDQRGGARVVGVRCDIGAFEYGAQVPLLYLPMVIRN